MPYTLQDLYEGTVDSIPTLVMLPKSVICPRCRKRGFLTLRWTRSSRSCKNEPLNQVSHWIDMPLANSVTGKSQGGFTTKRKRNLIRYAPTRHLYIGHYDSEKYRDVMESYKIGRLKSRPNGRIWHKVRRNRVIEQVQSDLEKLMDKYNFARHDLNDKIREMEEELRLRRGIF